MFTSFYARGLGLRLSARDSIELAASEGFAAVDLLVRDLLEQGEDSRDLQHLMKDLGLRGGAWALPVDWRSEPEVFERDRKALPRLAAVAAELGLFRTGTWVLPAGLLPGMDEGTDARARLVDAHVERLGLISRVLSREGIRLGLEVIGPETFRTGRGPEFIHRLGDPDLAILIDRLNATLPSGSPRVGILLDTFHLHASGETLEPVLDRFGVESIVWVHVADLPADFSGDRSEILDHDRGLPGESGLVPNAWVLKILDGSGYQGPISAEPLAGCRRLKGRDAAEIAHVCALAMRSVWPGSQRPQNELSWT
ncbi:MAG TPA: sugar phosphate isomerase/epimerase family protein [Isosphaeraceae bacterium]|nr:sugar phosphate isomerase/epimerase family protein [Isosphaeraceae bacterium]